MVAGSAWLERAFPEDGQRMSLDEDELLVLALGDVGGFMGPRARRGAESGARRLRKDVFEVDLVVSMSPQAARDRAEQVIAEQGDVLSPDGSGEDPAMRVIGIVGAGAANLNPAVVTVTIHPAPEGSRLVVRGAAKEGLIKQKTGTKAAKRVAAAMAPGVGDVQPG
jgi:hypothetical protein